MVRHNNREHKSIIQSFLAYEVKQQDSSDKHNDCSDHNIVLVPCGLAEIYFHSSFFDDCCQVP